MLSWVLGITGLSGIVGLAVMAIVGVPILPTVAKLGESLLTPLFNVLGQGLASLVKLEIDGGVDIMQTGQRILFTVTCCAITWSVATHYTWNKVHSEWALYPKHTVVSHRR